MKAVLRGWWNEPDPRADDGPAAGQRAKQSERTRRSAYQAWVDRVSLTLPPRYATTCEIEGVHFHVHLADPEAARILPCPRDIQQRPPSYE